METKDTLSSCSNLEEQEIQQLQMQAKISKENSLNKLNALKTTIQHLSSSNHSMYNEFREAFYRLFGADVRFFKDVAVSSFHTSKMFEMSTYKTDARGIIQDFNAYTTMEAQTFKETIVHNMNFIEQCIVERARHEQDIQNRLKSLNERMLQTQECKVQEVQSSVANSGDESSSRIVSDEGNDHSSENQSNTSRDESSRSWNDCNETSNSGDDMDIRPSYDTEPMVEVLYTAEYNVFAVEKQHYEQPESITNTCVVETVDSNAILDSSDMCNNDDQTDQNDVVCDDEHVALANLKLNIDENINVQKQLKKANASLTQELKECKSNLEESIATRDSCLIALQTKQTEFEKYIAFNDRTVDYDKLQSKLNETLGLLAQKDNDIKEGLKLKAYEISVVKQKHDELVKQSLLTKSSFEGRLKEKNKVISDLKVKEGKDIDKMIAMDKQLKFLNEIIPYDNSDLANIFAPNWEETITLEKESRSKLDKDLVKPYDYT
ncbi:hypothetical protein Tco_1074797, partial [Tanacetum coccineum]